MFLFLLGIYIFVIIGCSIFIVPWCFIFPIGLQDVACIVGNPTVVRRPLKRETIFTVGAGLEPVEPDSINKEILLSNDPGILS